MIDRVLSCVNEDKIKVVDLRSILFELKQKDDEKYQRLFRDHMTAEGNYLVAHILSETMAK